MFCWCLLRLCFLDESSARNEQRRSRGRSLLLRPPQVFVVVSFSVFLSVVAVSLLFFPFSLDSLSHSCRDFHSPSHLHPPPPPSSSHEAFFFFSPSTHLPSSHFLCSSQVTLFLSRLSQNFSQEETRELIFTGSRFRFSLKSDCFTFMTFCMGMRRKGRTRKRL